MILCSFMETFIDVFIYRLPVQIFYNEESPIVCTIQPSGAVFRGVFERQFRKLFVHYEMGYNSKNIRAGVKSF